VSSARVSRTANAARNPQPAQNIRAARKKFRIPLFISSEMVISIFPEPVNAGNGAKSSFEWSHLRRSFFSEI
jgi:hypothetical protein